MKKILFVIICAMFFMQVIGCATIFKGTSDNVNFNSQPAGAGVYVNGNYLGVTPVKLKLQSKQTHYIELKKEGYGSRMFTLTNSIGVVWIVLDVLGGLIPVVIDAATGSWYTLDQDNINVSFDKTGAEDKLSDSSWIDALKKESEKEKKITLAVIIGAKYLEEKEKQSLLTKIEKTVFERLGKTVRIVDRNIMEKVLKEQAFQMSGAVDEKARVETGKITGATHLMFVNLEIKQSDQSKFVTEMTIRIVQVETGEVIFSGLLE